MPTLKAVLTPEEKHVFKAHYQARGATEAGVLLGGQVQP